MSLEEKAILVTGAGSGIGRAAASLFLESGAEVVLCDRDAAALEAVAAELAAAGGGGLALTADVTDRDQVAAAVAAAVERCGRLDGALNCAGVESEQADTAEVAAADWQRVIDVNLSGVFNCMQAEIAAMLERGGAIVNVASSLGLVGAAKGSPYSAAKHGVVGLTKSAAIEYAARGVRINALCPGIVNTPMTARLLAELPGAEEMLPAIQPIGRLARPREIAAAARFLLSDDASFVVGAALAADGGHVAQ